MTAPTAATPRTVTIVLPLPPEAVSPNARVHFGTRARATAEYRQAAGYAAIAERARHPSWRFERAQLQIRYVVCPNNPFGNRGRACPRDQDTAQSCAKSAIDGVVKGSGLLIDDNAGRLTTTTTLERHRKGRCPAQPCRGSRVEMCFTEVLP